MAANSPSSCTFRSTALARMTGIFDTYRNLIGYLAPIPLACPYESGSSSFIPSAYTATRNTAIVNMVGIIVQIARAASPVVR